MNDSQLKAFIRAAELKSFTKAANAEKITTPTLIQKINLLELESGIQIFNRTHKGIELTAAGKVFYDASKKIIELSEKACQEARLIEKAELQKKVIRIGQTPEWFPQFFIKACEKFQNEHADIKLEFIPCHFIEHFEKIRKGEIDMGLLSKPSASYLQDLDFTLLKKSTCAFCMNNAHPLAKKSFLSGKELKNARVLCGMAEYMESTFESALSPFCPNLTIEKANFDSNKVMRHIMNGELYVVTSEGTDYYEGLLTVVPSKIPIGNYGIVHKKEISQELSDFMATIRLFIA